MSEPDESPSVQPEPSLPTNIRGIDPGELFARGMQSVKMSTGGANGWTPPTVEEVARLFPTYEVLSVIGRGGMGAVYKARQIALDRMVAIKLLPLEISVDKDFTERFTREARAMAKLNHSNIIAVYEFGKTSEGHLFFGMEFVEGANLHQIIHGVGLDADQALSLATQVCSALGYAHGKGVVHRDIKPANVMVDIEGNAKVADFGLARLTEPGAEIQGTTMTGAVMGTPDYMAPEQKRGMRVDHRADIYSLGVMLYEMLCRKVPQGYFAPPSQVAGCDPRLDKIVMRAMQQEPDQRYQTTQEMKLDVDHARTWCRARRVTTPKGHSFRQRSLLLLTTGIALASAFAGLVSYEWISLRASMVRNLTTLTDTVGRNSFPALTYRDSEEGEETLLALRVESSVLSAALYDDKRQLFASYVRAGISKKERFPDFQDSQGTYFEDGQLMVVHPLIFSEKRLGTICVKTNLAEITGRLRSYAELSGLVLLGALGFGIALTSLLRRFVSHPRLALVLGMSSALVFACAGVVYCERVMLRETLTRHLSSLTGVVGGHCTPALVFGVKDEAQEVFGELAVESLVVAGSIYTENGQILAKYVKKLEDENIPLKPGTDGTFVERDRIIVVAPVLLDAKRIGTIYVKGSLGEIPARLRSYAIISGLFLVGAMLLGLALTVTLRKVISRRK